MNIVFMGSDEIACPSLRALSGRSGIRIAGVVTQPDRPQGRNKKMAPCELKACALSAGLSVFSPERIGSLEAVQEVQALSPDLIAVVAYGQYIPDSILAIPRHGAINLHPSLLPKYRGASPIQQAVAHGETETGVTVLYVAKEMDAGDILLQEKTIIGAEETAVELGARLAEQGARLLVRAVDEIRTGQVTAHPQAHAEATTVFKLTKEDGRIDWTMPAGPLHNRIRGFQPWPVCFCEIEKGSNRLLRIYRTRIEPGTGAPGQVISTVGDGPLVATGRDALRLLDVKPDGKNNMTGAALVCGRYIREGMVLN